MTARRAFLKWLGAVPAAATLLPGASRAALVDSGRGHVRLEDERIGLHFDDALRCRIVAKVGTRTQALTRFDACGVALKGRRPVDRFTLVSAEPHAGQTPFGAGQSLRLVGRSREGLVKEMTITLLDAFPGTALVDVAYTNPGPAAHLNAFGADGLELTVYFWIRDPENGTANVRSGVNLAILALFKAMAVEIPYPQRVLRQLPAAPAA